MRTVNLKLFNVNFEVKDGDLFVSIQVPLATASMVLIHMNRFKKSVQFFPGGAGIYHYILLIEEAIAKELKK